ncbi:MAG: hypothetical protein RO469_09205 [Thermincola sp.]|jgi:hypothetical protein|nr:hypothetical protein [Thermincola sp.]MDT3702252.1 hypothetical protein [Thermincola sp.]
MKLRKDIKGEFALKGGTKLKSLVREIEPRKLTCMAEMKKMVRTVLKESGASREQVIRSFGLNRRNGK